MMRGIAVENSFQRKVPVKNMPALLTCSAREIHHGRDALLKQPGGSHGLSDFLCAFLCTGVIIVPVCYYVKVVFVRCFEGVHRRVGWVARMWGVRVMIQVVVCMRVECFWVMDWVCDMLTTSHQGSIVYAEMDGDKRRKVC